jgi:hypothetical protein
MEYGTAKAHAVVATRRELTGHLTDLPRARPIFRGRVTRVSCQVCSTDLAAIIQRFQHTTQISGPRFEEESELLEDLEPVLEDDPDDADDADWRQDISDLDDVSVDWTRELPFLFTLDLTEDDEFYDA